MTDENDQLPCEPCGECEWCDDNVALRAQLAASEKRVEETESAWRDVSRHKEQLRARLAEAEQLLLSAHPDTCVCRWCRDMSAFLAGSASGKGEP